MGQINSCMNRLVTISQTAPSIYKAGIIKTGNDFWARLLVYFSIFLLSADLIYKLYFGISYQNRQDCVLYGHLPRWAFLFYEYFIELFLILIVGIFLAALLEKYFARFGRFVPRNPLTAFLYASIIPVCSCSAIPVIAAVKDKIPLKTIITFIVAAPLLNPYIIIISAMVLGTKYLILRIAGSFILAIFTGYIAEYSYKKMNLNEIGSLWSCRSHQGCHQSSASLYEKTFAVFKKVFLFMLAAAVLSVAMELFSPDKLLANLDLTDNYFGLILVILVGVPVYFCNGADVLFLKPLIQFADLPLGTAIAFSLTSTSVCITSLFLMAKFVGKKLTAIILASIVLITFLLGLIIQAIPL